jgi:hypothetical protein
MSNTDMSGKTPQLLRKYPICGSTFISAQIACRTRFGLQRICRDLGFV